MPKAPLTIGSWVTLYHPSIIEIMATAGFDWLTVDMEHTVIDYFHAQQMIATIQAQGLQAFVRLPENNTRIIKRVLDAGADGIIVPNVRNRAEAERAAAAANYPPVGVRGVGLARAQGYGLNGGFEAYREGKAKKITVIAQIEHIEAIDDLEPIIETPGIHGTLIGPYDLSGSMGKPGRYDEPDVKKALERYETVARRYEDKLMGFHVVKTKAGAFMEKVNLGYNFLAFSLDTLFLGEMANLRMGEIREHLADKK